MKRRTTWLVVLCGLCLALAGCQRLHSEKSWDLNGGDSQCLEVDAPRGEQKVEVQVEASAPVPVYVVLENEVRDFQNKSGMFDRTKALTAKERVTNETIQATVPAGSKFGVIVGPASKATKVKIVVDGR